MSQYWIHRDSQLWVDRDSQLWVDRYSAYAALDTVSITSKDVTKELLLRWDDDFLEADFVYLNGDLTTDQGLESAIIISLFTDQQAAIDDVLPDINSTDRRGWWGDLASPDVENDKIGSKLWLLERSKTEESVISDAKKYTEDALEWLIEDNIASEINVNSERQESLNGDILAIEAEIILTDSNIITVRFSSDSL